MNTSQLLYLMWLYLMDVFHFSIVDICVYATAIYVPSLFDNSVSAMVNTISLGTCLNSYI